MDMDVGLAVMTAIVVIVLFLVLAVASIRWGVDSDPASMTAISDPGWSATPPGHTTADGIGRTPKIPRRRTTRCTTGVVSCPGSDRPIRFSADAAASGGVWSASGSSALRGPRGRLHRALAGLVVRE